MLRYNYSHALSVQRNLHFYTYVVHLLGQGRKTRLALWDDPADDITGVIARSEKVAGTFQKVSGNLQSSSNSS